MLQEIKQLIKSPDDLQYYKDMQTKCGKISARLSQIIAADSVFRGNPATSAGFVPGTQMGGAVRGGDSFHLDSWLLDSAEVSPNTNWKSVVATAAMHEAAHSLNYAHSNTLVYDVGDYPFNYLNYSDAASRVHYQF